MRWSFPGSTGMIQERHSRNTLVQLKNSAPKYLTEWLWKILTELKINRNKKTKRGRRGGKTRKRKQESYAASMPIPVLITSRFKKTNCNRAVNIKTDFSILHKNLQKPEIVNNSAIKFCCFNARSISNKSLAISQFVLSNKIDICAITETWLTQSSPASLLNELTPRGYEFIHHPRAKRRGGGLGIIFKDCINIKKITIGKSATVSFECLNCIATVKNKSVIIGIIYRPPPTNANGFSNTAFFNEWEDYLNNLMLLKHEILLTGDINFHLDCKTSSSTKQFLSTLDSCNFSQHVDAPTHICGHTLDFVATLENSPILLERPKVLNTLITDSKSGKLLDHFAVIFHIQLLLNQTRDKNTSYRNLKKLNIKELTETLSIHLEHLPSMQNIDRQIELYNSSLQNALDNMVPLITKSIHVRESQPWYNSNLQTSKRLCRKLERLWKKSKLTVHKLAFEEQCAIFNKLLLKSKKSYILSLIADSKKDISKLYKVMNKLLKPKSSKKLPQNESPAKFPNIFANFFQSKIAEIQNSLDAIYCSNKFETDLKHFEGTSFENFTPTTQTQVNNIICSLNTTTCNLNPIPTTVLKKCSPGIIAAITAIINSSLRNAVVPFELKKAIVSPLFKIKIRILTPSATTDPYLTSLSYRKFWKRL